MWCNVCTSTCAQHTTVYVFDSPTCNMYHGSVVLYSPTLYTTWQLCAEKSTYVRTQWVRQRQEYTHTPVCTRMRACTLAYLHTCISAHLHISTCAYLRPTSPLQFLEPSLNRPLCLVLLLSLLLAMLLQLGLRAIHISFVRRKLTDAFTLLKFL